MNGVITYLGKDQQNVINWAVNPNSCTTIAIYMVQFLIYTGDNPTVDKIVEHMTKASQQWLQDDKYHNDRYEQAGKVFARLSIPQATMAKRDNLDVCGMNVLRSLTGMSNDVNLAYGFKEGLDRLLKVINDNKRPGKNVLGAVVVYGDYSFAICLKVNDSKAQKLVIDVIDSHRKILRNPLPPRDLPYGSALWGRFYSTEGAAKFMEELYQPKETDAELTKLSGVKLDKEATDKQRAASGLSEAKFEAKREMESIPKGMYEMQIFVPIRRNRADAEETIDRMSSS